MRRLESRIIELKRQSDCLHILSVSVTPASRSTDRLIVAALSLRDIHPGDVIVFRDPNHHEGNKELVHRVIAVLEEGRVASEVNSRFAIATSVTSKDLIGRVTHLERDGATRRVAGSRLAVPCAHILHSRHQIWKLMRRLGRPLLGYLRKAGLTPRMGRPAIQRILAATDAGPLVKYLRHGRTVACWWPEENRFEYTKPAALIFQNGVCQRPTKTAKIEDMVDEILRLSFRISTLSLPMKPFIRCMESDRSDRLGNNAFSRCRRLMWDFDDLLQKRLLHIARKVASPDVLIRLGIDQWKRNLRSLAENKQQALDRLSQSPIEVDWNLDSTTECVVERMREGARILNIGCGSGTDSFLATQRGLRIIGIDTWEQILHVARHWSVRSGIPVHFVCMDVVNLAFAQDTFDGFVGPYGFLPSLSQSLKLQCDLSQLLKPGGRGFLVGCRKKYASHMSFLNLAPSPLGSWLGRQASMDFRYSEADNCEERLLYGLYNESHTVESLTSELSYVFEVIECFYQNDPRYLMAVVGRKEGEDYRQDFTAQDSPLGPQPSAAFLSQAKEILRKIDLLCILLEVHARTVSAFARRSKAFSPERCLTSCCSEVPAFLHLLDDTLKATRGYGA